MASNLKNPDAGVMNFITYYQAPDKLIFNINRNVQVNTISRDGQLLNQLNQASNAVNIIEKDGKAIGIVDHKGQVFHHHHGDRLTPMVSNFIKCSDTTKNGCFGGNGKFDEPLEPNTVTKKRVSAGRYTTFPSFEKLPQEVKDMILGEVIEPHTVRVYQAQRSPEHDQYVVAMDREWADIALYQVCRWFRQYAIKRFGVPKQHHRFPFDPINDTLYLLHTRTNRIFQLLRTGRKAKVFDFYLDEFERHYSIDHELWDRIQTVETDARMPAAFRSCYIGGDYRMFRNIRTWRILTIQFDTCKTAFNPDAETLFRLSDFSILHSFVHCLYNSSGIWPPLPYNKAWEPKVIEICRKGCVCSNTEKLTWKNTRTPTDRSFNELVKIGNKASILDMRNWS